MSGGHPLPLFSVHSAGKSFEVYFSPYQGKRILIPEGGLDPEFVTGGGYWFHILEVNALLTPVRIIGVPARPTGLRFNDLHV